jgi:hypothetical protein
MPRNRNVRGRKRALWLRGLVIGLMLVVASCGSDDNGDASPSTSRPIATTTTPRTDTARPVWVTSVSPEDGAATPDAVVSVGYGVLPPRHEIRLVIDGVDVTSQSLDPERLPNAAPPLFPSPGTLRYEPSALDRPLVMLPPGKHLATVKQVVLPEFGATLTTVDEYDWSFEVR